MLDFGTTRVELGVQTLDDEVHQLTRRGHGVAEAVTATRLLRDYGFKVYYHWMPGLPGSTPEHDLELSQILFDDENFRPDGVKLYPTLVVAESELAAWYRDGRYKPYTDEQMTNLLMEIKKIIPKYVRIPRLMRDIPVKFIIAGSKDLGLRGTIKKRMDGIGVRCRCIRCREYGHRLRDGWTMGVPQLTRLDYETEGGREIFLSFEDMNETLFGLLRLRIKSSIDNGEMAIIRELHVFGPELVLEERRDNAPQHRGLGAKLIREAEKIAREEFYCDKIDVLSGIGVRVYYRSLGYHLDGNYMVKRLA